jgi:murein DD-endopeptidase MepM/ murein hydrolase activator NlpD
MIKTSSGHVIYYTHMATVNVKVGQNVTAGQVIGTSGNTGCSSGPHLHFDIYGPGIDTTDGGRGSMVWLGFV